MSIAPRKYIPKPSTDVASKLAAIDLRLDVRIGCDGLQQKFQHAEFVTCNPLIKAGLHRNDYERIQLKIDLRLVKIIKSEAKPFHICLKNMFSNDFVKLFFKIHNFSLS